jgi:hypothetical protein
MSDKKKKREPDKQDLGMADLIKLMIEQEVSKQVQIEVQKTSDTDVPVLKEYITEVISVEIKKHLIGVFEELLVKLKGE